ncbi:MULTISPECIES: membrane protein insertase YidC [Methylococcus]|uniref:Membrane protein insertase YidC n=1 Tax=Methylococcus capsulatus (strain ATCC 33009 / NCIMB 11132 / Bath) TaxID=243233 RepID=YIDC_METCA|nr:membrane protein insertase YidC [Methylococcus capsulatus]Q602M6.1 RecName: Full=Membrane protein insertase YidC; AltName: Full=Foldase YidC; AltName: Full=Membrane integrase YidC; AltName: Full=Membrane protein YidC [Methylococcus capsulatus str. Bath]AAU90904.1 inner membrane protein, 60 kDa [Methylococcus capsulatus str. Bath]QXP86569.1 membrane protein insertase YidC [Methylococcus capsulatus]QXP93753.1 membrane protein insertase YidC [Methylococcus capsulatus]UQN11526.1 membrane protei
MDNLRFVLFVFFIFLSFLLWEQWQIDYGPKPQAVAQTDGASRPAGDLPQRPSDDESDVTVHTEAPTQEGSRRIRVHTDVLSLEIDTRGGDLRQLDLLNYPVSKEQPDRPVRLLTDQGDIFVAQSGFIGAAQQVPNHHSLWQAEAGEYRLQDGQDILRVPLTWSDGQGVTVTKTYILRRGSYLIDMEQTIDNRSNTNWTGRQYMQLQRKEPTSAQEDSQFIRTYTGGVLHTEDKSYEKIAFKDMASGNLDAKSRQGWIAMIQHYFLAAWVPPAEDESTFYTKALADRVFVIGAYSPPAEVPAGSSQTLKARLFAGPKLQHVLEGIAPGLELTADFGILTVIAKPIYWLLETFHGFFNNWGWAIIFVTLVIKALFFKLSEASYRSMANMRKLQPKLVELKERYGEDRQRYNQAMMELYRKEKVNPLGGCLPILVQIPVFISLYWVLVESVDLRQAPFLLWLDDLSSKDPYFVLPLIMGVSMFIQQRLNPPPTDPIQARVMQFFPLVFTVFFLFFPSGLVLYWVVNNILSIIQQWYITRQIEKNTARA